MIVIIIFQHTHAIQEPNCESIANDWETILRGFPAKWIIDRITICRQAIKNAVIWEFMWEVLNHILHVNVPINIRLQRAVLSGNYVSFCGNLAFKVLFVCRFLTSKLANFHFDSILNFHFHYLWT